MKRIFFTMIFAVAMAILPMSCVGQAKVLRELATMPDVESVYIGKAAMRLAKGASMMSGMGKAASAIKGVESVEVIECDNRNSIKAVAEKAKTIIDRMKLEVIVETIEKDETTRIYGRVPEDGNEEYIESVLIESRSPSEYDLVFITGKINLAELMND